MQQDLVVEAFQRADQDAARALVLSYLAHRFGELDRSLNRDLEDIAVSYASGHVVVAGVGQRLVGVGMLLPHNADEAEIKRMCVAEEARRMGIGRAILRHLVENARTRGFTRIFLYTSASWEDAMAFYLGSGLTILRYEQTDFTYDAVFGLDLERT